MFWRKSAAAKTPHDPVLMRLAKSTVTQGSRVVIPLYPALFILVGLINIFQSAERTSGPAYAAAKALMPIQWWGMLFLAIGAAEALCWLNEQRRPFMDLLVLGSGLCAFWGMLFFIAAADDGHVSWSGPVWLFFASGCHVASTRSLARDLILGDDEKP